MLLSMEKEKIRDKVVAMLVKRKTEESAEDICESLEGKEYKEKK